MIKDIITDEAKLSEVSEKIYNEEIATEVVCDLIDTAKQAQRMSRGCAGLAANQIGHLHRAVVVWLGGKFQVMINPEIDLFKGEKDYKREGCLSRPGHEPRVMRYKKITVRYLDEQFNLHERKFSGMTARVIQHEVDHLNGKYITQTRTPYNFLR